MLCVLCVTLLCGCTSADADSTLSPAVIYESKDIQLDLAGMSGTVVYSMICNIMSDPTPYLDKVIRVGGYYSAWEDPNTGIVYHSCVIPDATACCAQGMEFVWAGEHESVFRPRPGLRRNAPPPQADTGCDGADLKAPDLRLLPGRWMRMLRLHGMDHTFLLISLLKRGSFFIAEGGWCFDAPTALAFCFLLTL